MRWGVLIHGITTALDLVVVLHPQINMIGACSGHIIETDILDLQELLEAVLDPKADILEAAGITTRW